MFCCWPGPYELPIRRTVQFEQQETKSKQKTRSHMSLEIKIQKEAAATDSSTATIKLTGSLDTMTAPELERELIPLLAGKIRELVFDLAQLKFISSSGLRVFAQARKQLKQAGGQALFIHLQPQIQEVFEIIRSLPGIAIFKDLTELDTYLAARQHTYEANP
jgi:anti-sigma B factor antagonist